MDVARLLGAQDVSCSPDFQVFHRNTETGPKFSCGHHGLQPALGSFGKRLGFWNQQICVCSTRAASHPTAKLVKLGQPKSVRPIDDQSIYVLDVQTGFEYRGAYQNVELAFGEIGHRFLEPSLAHLTVGDSDLRFWYNSPDIVGHVSDVINAIVQEIDLALSVQLSQDGFPD